MATETPTTPPIETLPDARWDCHGCTTCCRSYLLGPVEPEVVARLESLGVSAQHPGWYRTQPGPAGPAHFLARRDGACVFLQDNGRCEIHARFGADHKPGFCREYPFQSSRDGTRTTVTVRPSCAGLHQTWRTGTAVATGAQEIVDLPRVLPIPRASGAPVPLLPGVGVSPETWKKLVPALLRRLEGFEGTPGAVAADVRAAIVAATNRPLPPADPSRVELAARLLVERLLHLTRTAASMGEGEPWQRQFFVDASDLFDAALARRAPPAWDHEVSAYLAMVYRSELLSGELLRPGGLSEGTGTWLLGAWIVRRAAHDPTLAEVGPRHALWSRLLENRQVSAFLRSAGAPLLQLFVHADPSAA